uniref:HDC18565 n=1 Tax=Drosophila melanogaster TaxID=7227 RepID=Q6IIE5_DROME|nr:TPA_inf: HDC18565 [Drosophila melanogaster]
MGQSIRIRFKRNPISAQISLEQRENEFNVHNLHELRALNVYYMRNFNNIPVSSSGTRSPHALHSQKSSSTAFCNNGREWVCQLLFALPSVFALGNHLAPPSTIAPDQSPPPTKSESDIQVDRDRQSESAAG